MTEDFTLSRRGFHYLRETSRCQRSEYDGRASKYSTLIRRDKLEDLASCVGTLLSRLPGMPAAEACDRQTYGRA